ncbi:unnamed protein product [Bemisia tabaci]|uniref:Phorbol-ester/DAG-type domain-containing protein n=1 Tax=Bemisia tabaci TaxID=7038 RepID=A0A9P0AGZ2_BEMTA|nr:unnamed protein product [Bemisia tabaci]
MAAAAAASASPADPGHGHHFAKKTFHKPTYCHHCTDLLWGIIGQGYICEGRPTPPRPNAPTFQPLSPPKPHMSFPPLPLSPSAPPRPDTSPLCVHSIPIQAHSPLCFRLFDQESLGPRLHFDNPPLSVAKAVNKPVKIMRIWHPLIRRIVVGF